MPIPKWCDRRSIRTVMRKHARVLICCQKKKWKNGRCAVGTRAIEVKPLGGLLTERAIRRLRRGIRRSPHDFEISTGPEWYEQMPRGRADDLLHKLRRRRKRRK